jgi:hypothetical protein
MSERTLHYYWVEHDDPHGPIGYGVTAFSEEDAFSILDSAGYELYTTDKYREIQTVSEIPSRIVKERMGPIVVRGIWYPFTTIGAEP